MTPTDYPRPEPDSPAPPASSRIGAVCLLLFGSMIVAALVVPRVVSHTCDACIAAGKSDLSTMSSGLQNFRLDCDRYPTTKEGLASLTIMPRALKGVWKGPYLTNPVPPDPWGNPYVYEFRGPDSYLLESYGSDGKPGGEGDAADIVEGSD